MSTRKIYHGDWEGDENGRAALLRDFSITEADLAGVEILFATYTYEDYSGSAFVLFRKDGTLYEVNGGHCSCYGLEDQWTPEETTAAALNMRKFGDLPDDQMAELRELISSAGRD